MKISHRLALIAAIAVVTVGCDQVTKRIASETLKFSPPQSYLGGLFRLEYSENPGAFLSLGAELPPEVRTWVFKWGIAALLVATLGFALLGRHLRALSVAGLALFLGGGFSNLADRIVRGDSVVDFMNVGIGRVRSGVFNVADLSIIAGLILVVLGSIMDQKPRAVDAESESPTD